MHGEIIIIIIIINKSLKTKLTCTSNIQPPDDIHLIPLMEKLCFLHLPKKGSQKSDHI